MPAPNQHRGDVVVRDDVRVHDSEAAEAAVRRAGARDLRLPPYSPDYNPIEER